jgi:hypothetical protein
MYCRALLFLLKLFVAGKAVSTMIIAIVETASHNQGTTA